MIARALLALGAYSPVAILIGVRITRSTPSWTFIGIGLVAIAATTLTLVRARLVSSIEPLDVATTEDKASDVPAYMMSYLLPFVTVANPNHRDLIVLAAFGAVLLIVSARSDVLTVNPLLFLAGFRVYKAKVMAGATAQDTVTLLSRRPPIPVTDTTTPEANSVNVRIVATGIYLASAS